MRIGAFIFVATLQVLLVDVALAHAVERCSAKINSNKGALEVQASGAGANPRWGTHAGFNPATEGVEFVDAGTCCARGSCKQCHLGGPGTLAERTPPATCNVCVTELVGGVECCAYPKGCTPGIRLRDGSFAAADPRFEAIEAVGSDTLRFTAVNVQVVDGSGDTDGPTNGRGNFIVGYNEGASGAGSHNIVVGTNHTYSSYGGFVAGSGNTIAASFAVVSGGIGNVASGVYASVCGGNSNSASSHSASVSGGIGNVASGVQSSVSGGFMNTAYGDHAAVCGGDANYAAALNASVTGGFNNIANGTAASISGGESNLASGLRASVSGGQGNVADSRGASVSGGGGNLAHGANASVSGGGYNEANGDAASVSGGENNLANGTASSVSGGNANEAYLTFTSVSGGEHNLAGAHNAASLSTGGGYASSVSGGIQNQAFGDWSSISGGQNNQTGSQFVGAASSVSGGVNNFASNNWSSVSGGNGIGESFQAGWSAGSKGSSSGPGRFFSH